MSVEIERKFLVEGDEWRSQVLTTPSLIEQAYIAVSPEVRVRIQSACTPQGEPFGQLKASLCILGVRTDAGQREVFDYEVPVQEASRMLTLCKYRLKKIRHKAGASLTVDEFLDEQGSIRLILAELKIFGQNEPQLPDWIGKEVTGQVKFTSAWIAKHGV